MNEAIALTLIVVLATAGYAAGRMHGQFSYRWGFRYGYRQGYFDGDRASWNRRRRDLQAAVASVLTAVTESDERQFELGSIYTSAARGEDEPELREPETPGSTEPAKEPPVNARTDQEGRGRGVVPRGRHARTDREAGRSLAEAAKEP